VVIEALAFVAWLWAVWATTEVLWLRRHVRRHREALSICRDALMVSNRALIRLDEVHAAEHVIGDE
jgi:hypothetical protein